MYYNFDTKLVVFNIFFAVCIRKKLKINSSIKLGTNRAKFPFAISDFNYIFTVYI